MLAAIAMLFAAPVVLADPKGDDKGTGAYVYPTDGVYAPGSFDLVKVEIEEKGGDVEFRLEVDARVEDPWDSKSWGGNGWSLQMAFVFIDQDHKEGSGATVAPPGLNVEFPKDGGWEKVVLISPQGRSRLLSEVAAKAKDLKDRIVIPKRQRAQGRALVATVGKQDLGGAPAAGWGWQVVVQSNEGYPDAKDLLTRKVNEFAGQHRFGGGTDWDCDPHAIDMLTGLAKGEPAEAEAQYQALKAYECNADGSTKKLAIVPMVYR
jgi:carbohydrate-binding DOMON domain-containing protein